MIGTSIECRTARLVDPITWAEGPVKPRLPTTTIDDPEACSAIASTGRSCTNSQRTDVVLPRDEAVRACSMPWSRPARSAPDIAWTATTSVCRSAASSAACIRTAVSPVPPSSPAITGPSDLSSERSRTTTTGHDERMATVVLIAPSSPPARSPSPRDPTTSSRAARPAATRASTGRPSDMCVMIGTALWPAVRRADERASASTRRERRVH
ncbi:hypothetical protein GA0061091_108162 [Gordonia sp. v-85]|nr:hypothetical protein GA0061091_108162 [Gordonia sp. v-85]